MSRFNLVRMGRSFIARRRNRWLDEAQFCDGCSRVDDVASLAVERKYRSVGLYAGHAPRSFG